MDKNMNMRTPVFYGFVMLMSVLTSFRLTESGNLRVTVTEIKNSDGEINFSLFNQAIGFPKDGTKSLKQIRGKIERGKCTVTFESIPYGKYAISIYHDENNDKQLNKSWYGKPIEGVAISNDVKGSMNGPPTFEMATFDFNSHKNGLIVKMNYF